MQYNTPLSINLHDMTWHFTTQARVDLWLLGAVTPEQLQFFATQTLSRKPVWEGPIEINFSGTGFRITKTGSEFFVSALVE